jgi:hypothetical protein
MFFKVIRKRKDLLVRKRLELKLFDQVLALCVVVWIIALAALVINPWKSSEQLLGNDWRFSNVPQAQIIGGLYGPEVPGFEWLTGAPLVVRVSNPLMRKINVIVQLKLGVSPCGTLPEFSPKIALVKSKTGEAWLPDTVLEINPNSYKDFMLTIISTGCKITTDPRIFYGAVFRPLLIIS